MQKVYVVLLNYNGTKDTIECLESLLKLEHDHFQIIVVDNSLDEIPLNGLINWANGVEIKIETKFENIIYPLYNKPLNYKVLKEDELFENKHSEKIVFVKAKFNKGFSAGNNIALRYIKDKGEANSFIWLLNNDTIVKKDTLTNLAAFYSRTNNIGLLGSTLLYYDYPNIIQSIGGKFNKKFYITSHLLEGKDINHDLIQSQSRDYIVGASMFISNNFLDTIGLLDESFFLYYEEVDWAFRARNHGLINYNCPEAIVYHKEGKSIGSSYDFRERSLFSELQIFISRKKFIKKHFRVSLKFYLSTMLLILNRLRRGQFNISFQIFKISFIKN